MAKHPLLTNVPITAPATSPTFTIPAGSTIFSYDIQIAAPTIPGNTFVGQIQWSHDGVNFNTVEQITVASGLHSGNPIVVEAIGEIVNLVQGDVTRAVALTVTGGTWQLTASISTA